ncbi:unnamed protein product [Phytophthora lilii]|uniref:Unnamed protein product n=1 Tax=Phytophthora lilii TaxID=2077276 RepID=A0A9W6TEH4_9STRA|nr:unnamed protein product [Phytophthora lilii]
MLRYLFGGKLVWTPLDHMRIGRCQRLLPREHEQQCEDVPEEESGGDEAVDQRESQQRVDDAQRDVAFGRRALQFRGVGVFGRVDDQRHVGRERHGRDFRHADVELVESLS